MSLCESFTLDKFKSWQCDEVTSWSQFTTFPITYLRGIISEAFSSTSRCHLRPFFQLFYHTPATNWTPILKLTTSFTFLCLRILCPRIPRCLSLWLSNISQTLSSNKTESTTLQKCLRNLAPSMTGWGPDIGNSDEGNVLKNSRTGLFLYDPCICGMYNTFNSNRCYSTIFQISSDLTWLLKQCQRVVDSVLWTRACFYIYYNIWWLSICISIASLQPQAWVLLLRSSAHREMRWWNVFSPVIYY